MIDAIKAAFVSRRVGGSNRQEIGGYMFDVNEDKLERAYWEFDHARSKGNLSERDCFKQAMRSFARSEIRDKATIKNILKIIGGYFR